MNRAIQATLLMLAMAGVLALAPAVWAQTVPTLNTFTNNTAADATAVNNNFTNLKNTVNSHNTTIVSLGSSKQNNVTGSCAAGNAIRVINANGLVTCQKVPGGVISVSPMGANAFNLAPLSDPFRYRTQTFNFAGAWGIAGDSSATGAGTSYLTKSVELPHGVTVTSFKFVVYDNSATYDISALLYRNTLSGGFTAMANASSTSASTAMQTPTDTTISFGTIDNNNYVYWLYFYFRYGTDATLLGPVAAVITYTY